MQQAISYKDADGFVIVGERSVHRFVAHKYKQEYDHLMRSGLYHELTDRSLLIPHAESLLTAEEKKHYYKLLIPELIPVISYPYEWTASQWQQVVSCFLEINILALKYGMILKDATPFNFSFYEGECIFFDTLSFEFYHEGDPWTAYRQFCELMLGPLLLLRFNHPDWTRQLTAAINGWNLKFISRNLPLRSYISLAALLHIHWHSRYAGKSSGSSTATSFTKQKLELLWSSLHWSVRRLKIRIKHPGWSDYYDTTILSDTYLQHKKELVKKIISALEINCVVDLGANTGTFSFLAADLVPAVVALEADHLCLEELRRNMVARQVTNITTLLSNIAEPAPGIGWNNAERFPLLQRLHGDMVFALALIHHLCIGQNIPLGFVAELLFQMTGKYVLIEFIPKADPRVRAMLADRKDIFDAYSEDGFVHCFTRYFILEGTYTIADSERKLFLWKKR